MTKYLLTALCISTIIYSSTNNTHRKETIAHNICCNLFGKEDASKEINEHFFHAAENFTLPQTKQFPIKYIHSPSLSNQFSSFTWFGTWVNKNDWNRMDDSAKQWQAHHEIAHAALNHPQKQITISLLTTLIGTITAQALKLDIIKTIILTLSCLTLTMPLHTRKCEQEADIAAANILCKINKQEIVEKHIATLSNQHDEFSPWFNTSTQQKILLETIINKA